MTCWRNSSCRSCAISLNAASQMRFPINSASRNSCEYSHQTRAQRRRFKPFDVQRVRRDFPILSREVAGHPLAYLDNAASARRPQASSTRKLTTTPRFTPTCTAACTPEPAARPTPTRPRARRCSSFINAGSVRGDRVRARHDRGHQPGGAELPAARARGRATRSSSPGWSTTRTSCRGSCSCEQTGAVLRVAPIDDARRARCSTRSSRCCRHAHATRRAVAHVSNALGTIVPVEPHHRAPPCARVAVLLDGAQAVPHLTRRRAGARLRFLCLLRPQDVWTHRHRRALRARARCSRRCRRGRAAAT